MKAASARSSRARSCPSAPRSARPKAWTRHRSPSGPRPRRSRNAAWARRRNCADIAVAADLDIGVSSAPGGTSSTGRFGIARQKLIELLATGDCLLRLGLFHGRLQAAPPRPSGRSASWPLDLAAPICRMTSLRLACSSCSRGLGGPPRQVERQDFRRLRRRGRACCRPASKRWGSSRMVLRSCIASRYACRINGVNV